MIGILLVMSPGVPADDGIDFQQADQEDQAALELILRDVAHAVVAVIEVEDLFEPQNARDFIVVALVAKHVLADGAGSAQSRGVTHVVVGRSNQVARVPLFDELGNRARGEERNIIGMRLDRQ